MEDCEIIELYWQRSESAIEESGKKYGSYCTAIARNICRSREDAEECVSDTWFKAWRLIPPRRPAPLQSFFGALCRNLALDLWRRKNAGKRGGGETELCFEELSGCIPEPLQPEKIAEARELEELLRRFVHELPLQERRVFLARYYFMLPIKEIAAMQHQGLSKTKMCLYRCREKLRAELEREGLC